MPNEEQRNEDYTSMPQKPAAIPSSQETIEGI